MIKTKTACTTTTSSRAEKKDETQKKDEIIHVVIRPKPHVVFDESVIDNEFAGKKSSKSKFTFRPYSF